MKEDVLKLYEYLYRISSKNRSFKFKPSLRETTIIDNFVGKLTESHGKDWLFNFLTYQFSRYIDQDTQFGNGKILVGWVLGDKALQRFRDASEQELYYANQFIVNYEVKNILFERELIDDSDYKHRERMRYYGTDRGLVHCKTMINLFNPQHKDCIFCKYKEYCK